MSGESATDRVAWILGSSRPEVHPKRVDGEIVTDQPVTVSTEMVEVEGNDWEAQVDAALAVSPVTPPTPTGAHSSPRRCRPGRHEWERHVRTDYHLTAIGHHDCALLNCRGWNTTESVVVDCHNCGTLRDDAASRRGKSVVQRSKREERKLAHRYGGVRTGHHGGPDDVQTTLLNVQSKAGSGWWSTRYETELAKLPRTGGRIPVLVISNGQPGHLVRRVVVIDERDFRDLYGDLIPREPV